MKLWNSEWEGVVQYQRQQRRIADKLKKEKKGELQTICRFSQNPRLKTEEIFY